MLQYQGIVLNKKSQLNIVLRIKNSRGMTIKPSWFRSMRCAGPLTGSLTADWPWGLACHGVPLLALPLCKKHIWEPTAFIATPAKSLHGNRKNPKLQRTKLFLYTREVSTNAVSMAPV